MGDKAGQSKPIIAAALLPSAAALGYQSKLLSAGVLVEICLFVLFVTRNLKTQRPGAALWLLVAAGLPVWLRAESTTSVVKALLICTIAVTIAARYPPRRIAVTVIDAAGLYLALNVVGWAIGLHSPVAAERFGGYEGGFLFSRRVLLPFSTGINVPAGVAAAYVVGSLFLAIGGERLNTRRLLGQVIAVLVLAAAGARTPIVVGALVAVLAVWARPVFTRASTVLVPAVLCLPFYFSVIQTLVASITGAAQGLIPALQARAGQATNVSLNGRSEIWRRSLNYFGSRVPSVHQAIGYGTAGHIESGASIQYAPIFNNFSSDPSAISPHSSAVQQLFDAGIVGLIVLLAGVAILIWTLTKRAQGDPSFAALALFVVTLLLCFVVESSGAPDGMSEVYILILLAGASTSVARRVTTRSAATSPPGKAELQLEPHPEPALSQQ